MTICFVGKYSDQVTAGVHVSTVILARELVKLGHRVLFYGISSKNEHYTDTHGVSHRYLAGNRYSGKAFQELVLGDTDKIDLYCFQSVFIPLNFWFSRMVSKAGKPYVAFPRGGYNENIFKKSWLKKQTYFRLIEKRFLRSASGVVCVSDSEVGDLNRLGFKGPVQVTYCPIVQPAPFKEEGESHLTRKKLVFLGRFDIPTKGLDFLLSVAKEIQEIDQTVTLDLYGNGPDKGKMEAQIKRDRIKNTFFKAPVYGTDKMKAFLGATAYIQTSRWEGFGRSIAEAMILGIPCIISSEINMAKDIFYKYKLDLVIQRNPKEEAQKIVNFLNDNSRLQELSLKMRKTALQLFDSSLVAAKTALFFQKVIGQKSEVRAPLAGEEYGKAFSYKRRVGMVAAGETFHRIKSALGVLYNRYK